MPDMSPSDVAKYIRRALESPFTDATIRVYYDNARANAASQAVLDAIELRMRNDFR